MIKKFTAGILLLIALLGSSSLYAQGDTAKQVPVYKVGIFAPLYLDSVFSKEGKFKYAQGMPSFITPGVDFVDGAQLALDSLKLQNQEVKAFIYDTKSLIWII